MIIRYLYSTLDYAICYQGIPMHNISIDLQVFFYAYWVIDPDYQRSISGYVFNLFGGAVSWMSKR